jgi:hypothetical protein
MPAESVRFAARPNFLFIGPDKAGSSWLHYVLGQHPDCYVPPAKDLYFFDRHYARGWDWYAAHFRAAGSCRAVGELSHDYLFSPVAARRIAGDMPQARLITILREPVERSFSHYLYMIRSGRTRLPFEQALDQFPELIHNSLYARHLQPYFELFERPRLGVFYFDELRRSPQSLARNILAFLDLPWSDALEVQRRVRTAAQPRSFVAARLAKRGADLARQAGLAAMVGRIKHSRLADALYRPYAPERMPAIAAATRAALQQEFAPDLAQLARLLPGERPAWIAQWPTAAA